MNVTFVLKDGTKKIVGFKEGQTVLQVAEENGIKLNSNCEGFGVCGGCHVKIENLLNELPEISEKEDDTLDRVSGVGMNSRLACQVVLSSSLDGLIVKLV
ncbi:MAG: 2Fe-2S iron-sulfur cluster binding domain-containing protein [Alphaproteobacteria bacterium]|nr:2Fe-2S iron-sulfur cluster binding domain-containing protein [Alphaproteobacteria bacterium]